MTRQHLLELIERLHQLRVVLKSGDYDGADLMRAWCAMIDAAEAIRSQQAEIDRLTAFVTELAAQRTGDEMGSEEQESADYEDAFCSIVSEARTLLEDS